jgi:hypothetical protein
MFLAGAASATALSLAAMTPGPAGAKEAHEVKLKRPICEETYSFISGLGLANTKATVLWRMTQGKRAAPFIYANGKYGVSLRLRARAFRAG